MPTKLAVTEPEGNGIPLEAIRLVMDRLDRANEETVDVTPEPAPLPLDQGDNEGPATARGDRAN